MISLLSVFNKHTTYQTAIFFHTLSSIFAITDIVSIKGFRHLVNYHHFNFEYKFQPSHPYCKDPTNVRLILTQERSTNRIRENSPQTLDDVTFQISLQGLGTSSM